eukprot:TRINITY_DN5324_c0_g1_i2.p1 TRINITY_DN5324_c0_g1~~TRINITY_DN5324_c0_g1_i2.p1  ORF type:complete len:566 (-),score=144.47 TRINITY_DN5324_c0_g1_i2:29-1522(-)
MARAVRGSWAEVTANAGDEGAEVVGVGVDTTGSTPGPVDRAGTPLCLLPEFDGDLDACFWLWKDHTAHAEATEITILAKKLHPEYLVRCGGSYSSEWFWSKILHCLRTNRRVFDAAFSWVECCDFVTGVLTGTSDPLVMKRSRCAAGHKAMFCSEWGGLPSSDFLAQLDPALAELRRSRLFDTTYTSDERAGVLCAEWAERLGLPAGVPVAVGAIDAHAGAVGSGIAPGTLVKIMGTSTCDICVFPKSSACSADVPGICGAVDGSVLPGHIALEAGQAAVGDLFNWFVGMVHGESHDALAAAAAALAPGETGLLALDWNNGNRNVLADQRLAGLLVGQTLRTRPEEVYRALVEATAFGARAIVENIRAHGVPVDRVVACGGVADASALAMQIYADVLRVEIGVARSPQTCAVGAAIAGAVCAGAYASFPKAQRAMASSVARTYAPNPAAAAVYDELYALFRQLHDAFGLDAVPQRPLFNIMKDLMSIRDHANRAPTN